MEGYLLNTGRNREETEIADVQVPVNEIELTIARWKAGEKTTSSRSVQKEKS